MSSDASKHFDLSFILGIFLLLVAVSGNFVAETLSCQLQKLLSENMYVKNIVILMIIYFSLGFASSEGAISPHSVALQSVMIWMFFIFFNKMDITFTIAALVGLFFILVIRNYVEYYEKIRENVEIVPFLKSMMDNLFIGVCGVVIIGFLLYFKRQHAEYKKSFSLITFLFGNTKCKSLA